MSSIVPADGRRRERSPDGSASERARQKILSLEELGQFADAARRRGQSIVLAHRTFDLLHMGHVRHLEQARGLGDGLLGTITADWFVNNGPGPPVFTGTLAAQNVAPLS